MGEYQWSACCEQAAGFCRSFRAIEPVPALAGGNSVKCSRCKAGLFRRCQHIFNLDVGLAIKALCLLKQREGFVQTGDDAATFCKTARDIAGARAKIEHAAAGFQQSIDEQTLEKAIRKTEAIPGVICGGPAEINTHGADPM